MRQVRFREMRCMNPKVHGHTGTKRQGQGKNPGFLTTSFLYELARVGLAGTQRKAEPHGCPAE